MSGESAFYVLVLGCSVTFMITGAAVSSCQQKAEALNRAKLENEFCAKGDQKGGGKLVRGQDGSYVCIDPKAVKWERH